MTTVNQPRTTFALSNAAQQVQNTGQRVLIIGQMLGSAVASGELLTNISNNKTVWSDTFGARSQMRQYIEAFKSVNEATRLDVIPLADNGSAVERVVTLAFTGTATVAGSFTISAGSSRKHKLSIAVGDTDAAADVAAAVAAAAVADPTLAYAGTSSTGNAIFTASNGGTVANGDTFTIEGLEDIAGITATITETTPGSIDPTLTNVLDVIGDERYQAIVWPYSDAVSPVETLLNDRFNTTGKVLDGVAFVPIVDSVANIVSAANINSASVEFIADKTENIAGTHLGGAIVEPKANLCAMFAGIRALRLDVSAQNIASVVSSTYGARDAFGGPALASKPYFNTPFSNVNPIATGLGFTDSEIETLTAAGVSIAGNNIAGNTLIMGEAVTTYLTDSAGNADVTFSFLNYLDTGSQVREYFFNNMRARFGQSRLTTGDTLPGRDMANEAVIRAYCKQLYQALSGSDFVLLEAGEAALQEFEANLVVAIDKATGTVTITMKVPLVTQLRTINGTIQIAF